MLQRLLPNGPCHSSNAPLFIQRQAIDHTANEDLTISWFFPWYSDVLELLSEDDTDSAKTLMDPGTVMMKWNASEYLSNLDYGTKTLHRSAGLTHDT